MGSEEEVCARRPLFVEPASSFGVDKGEGRQLVSFGGVFSDEIALSVWSLVLLGMSGAT